MTPKLDITAHAFHCGCGASSATEQAHLEHILVSNNCGCVSHVRERALETVIHDKEAAIRDKDAVINGLVEELKRTTGRGRDQ